MRLKKIILHILCLSILLSFVSAGAELEQPQQELTVTSGYHSLDAAYSAFGQDRLITNAKSVLMYETNSDTLLYAWNVDQQLHPASFVKLMTALLVLENAQLSQTVVVRQEAISGLSKDAVTVKLQAGEVITVQQLLYCMLVGSANDAAAVLADHVSGSQTAFVELMNQRAAELGCSATVFINPHGLHHQAQLTTARDTCRILLEALKYEDFRTIFGTVYYTVEPTNLSDARNISTNNFLMNTESVGIHFDRRVTGGRAGTTSDGYRGIASISEKGDMEVVCIVMGSASKIHEDGYSVISYGGYPETIQLLDLAYSKYTRCQVLYADQVLAQRSVLNGDCDVFLTTPIAFTTVLPVGLNREQLQFRFADDPGAFQAPVEQGQRMGTLEIWHENACLAQTEVYAMNRVEVASVKKVSSQRLETGMPWWGICLIVVGVLAVGCAVVVVIRLKKPRRRRSGAKNRRKKEVFS